MGWGVTTLEYEKGGKAAAAEGASVVVETMKTPAAMLVFDSAITSSSCRPHLISRKRTLSSTPSILLSTDFRDFSTDFP